jgi:predicted nucleic acid-binding protein
MSKSELVLKLKEINGSESDDGSYSYINNFKKSPYKVLNKLVENKKLILLQKIKDKNDNLILYHTDTLLVFANFEEKKIDNYIAIGYLNELHQVTQLTKEHVYLCKEWNFDYILPENLANQDDNSFQNDELDELVNKYTAKSDVEDDDDDNDNLPNYEEILI